MVTTTSAFIQNRGEYSIRAVQILLAYYSLVIPPKLQRYPTERQDPCKQRFKRLSEGNSLSDAYPSECLCRASEEV